MPFLAEAMIQQVRVVLRSGSEPPSAPLAQAIEQLPVALACPGHFPGRLTDLAAGRSDVLVAHKAPRPSVPARWRLDSLRVARGM